MNEKEVNKEIRELLDSALKSMAELDYESAIEELKTAEIIDRENPEILYNLGIVHAKVGLHKGAIDYYEKVLNLDSSFVDYNNVKKLLAFSSISRGEMEKARKYLKEYIEIKTNDVAALSMLGYYLEKQGHYEDAIGIFERVLAVDEENLNAYNSLAYLYAQIDQNLDRAVEYCRKIVTKDPENPCYMDTAGFVHLKKGNLDMARNYLKKAYEMLPSSVEIKEHLTALLDI